MLFSSAERSLFSPQREQVTETDAGEVPPTRSHSIGTWNFLGTVPQNGIGSRAPTPARLWRMRPVTLDALNSLPISCCFRVDEI
jgi:hypothetical protein